MRLGLREPHAAALIQRHDGIREWIVVWPEGRIYPELRAGERGWFKALATTEPISIATMLPASVLGSGAPDLAGYASTVQSRCVINLTVQNIGTAAAIFPVGPTTIGLVRTRGHKPQKVLVDVLVLSPGSAVAAEYISPSSFEDLRFEVDPNHVIAESDAANDTNNVDRLSGKYECGPVPPTTLSTPTLP